MNFRTSACLVLFAVLIIFPASPVFGHGLGLDTIKSVNVSGKKISISVEMPLYFAESEQKQITITAIDEENKTPPKNVTFLIGLFHGDQMIIRNYFLAPEGVLKIDVVPTNEGEVEIRGEQDALLGAWYATESKPLELSGPIFSSGGLYTFEIEIRTIDSPTNIVEDQQTYQADVSVVQTEKFPQEDSEGNTVPFRIKSYFDKVSNFEYNPTTKTVTFDMPFDWSEKNISHIPVVHEEVHFPKEFAELLSPSYVGKANGIDLFKASVSVDDYTEEDERIVHFVLLTDHLRFLKNEQQRLGQELPDKITFTLTPSDEVVFPMIAMTKDEQIQVDLSWDPIEILPEQKTKFVFTFRNPNTGDTLRQSSYDFVILQNGKEIHRTHGNAAVGGSFEDYTFLEDQTGPTIIRFENIRDTNLHTEFGIVVAPEFGSLVTIILIVSFVSIILVQKFSKFSLKI